MSTFQLAQLNIAQMRCPETPFAFGDACPAT